MSVATLPRTAEADQTGVRMVSGAGAQSRVWLWLAVVLSLVSALPVMVAQYPQLTDYPAHLARYHVMLDNGHSPWLAKYYAFLWTWTGNLGVDLLIRPFAAVFGLELGGRIIVGLIGPLSGLGIVAVEWALRRRVSFGSFLALSLIWSPMLVMGLINYALGQAVAFWAFAAWVWLEGKRWRPWVFLPLSLVVWLCHLSAWGVLGIMVFGYEWHRQKSWRALIAPWPLLAPLAVMLLVHGSTSGEFSYGHHWWYYKFAMWLRATRDTNETLDSWTLVLVGVAIVVATALRRIDGRLGWGALILVVGSWGIPRHISGGDFADYRMITAGLAVACMAIDWPQRWPVLSLAAVGLFLLRISVTSQGWYANSLEMAEQLKALDYVPEGASVASAVLTPVEFWPINPFEHIGAYSVVRKDALCNANFAVPHIHMLHLHKTGYVDPSQRLFQPYRAKVDMAKFKPAEDADYLWYVGPRAPDTMPAGAVIIWRGPHSFLARLAKTAEKD
ncbi:MAG TPA: hypothetical protein VFF98_13675 [Novosphingobium sp.]|nr:hypothetical protein [Novosphingobium sp.]